MWIIVDNGQCETQLKNKQQRWPQITEDTQAFSKFIQEQYWWKSAPSLHPGELWEWLTVIALLIVLLNIHLICLQTQFSGKYFSWKSKGHKTIYMTFNVSRSKQIKIKILLKLSSICWGSLYTQNLPYINLYRQSFIILRQILVYDNIVIFGHSSFSEVK